MIGSYRLLLWILQNLGRHRRLSSIRASSNICSVSLKLLLDDWVYKYYVLFGCRSIEWGGEPGGNCYNQTTMIQDPSYWGSDSRKSIMKVIGQVFSESTFPVTFLNITQLSNYRKDAHTSIYKKQWNPLTPEQIANPVSYADCVHWCLPGVQDTWNELLFAKLFYP